MDFFQLFRIVLKIRTILAMFLVYRLVFWNNELQTTLFWTSIGKQIKLYLNFYLFLHNTDESHNSMRFSRKILEIRQMFWADQNTVTRIYFWLFYVGSRCPPVRSRTLRNAKAFLYFYMLSQTWQRIWKNSFN